MIADAAKAEIGATRAIARRSRAARSMQSPPPAVPFGAFLVICASLTALMWITHASRDIDLRRITCGGLILSIVGHWPKPLQMFNHRLLQLRNSVNIDVLPRAARILLPGLFPPAFRGPDGTVSVYFETAAVITVLVLLGQVLELRARTDLGRDPSPARSRSQDPAALERRRERRGGVPRRDCGR